MWKYVARAKAQIGRRMFLYALLPFLFTTTSALRCYTDVEATKGLSVECGMSTGCLKIYKKAATFNHNGEFIPTHRRGPDIDLFRGCFLVATADTCYDSSSSQLSYCWCSHTDLCNRAPTLVPPPLQVLLPLLLILLSTSLSTWLSSWSKEPTFSWKSSCAQQDQPLFAPKLHVTDWQWKREEPSNENTCQWISECFQSIIEKREYPLMLFY